MIDILTFIFKDEYKIKLLYKVSYLIEGSNRSYIGRTIIKNTRKDDDKHKI